MAVELIDGRLRVEGTPGPDQIEILRVANDLLVRSSGGDLARIPYREIGLIEVDAGDGDDLVRIDHNVSIDAVIDGGPGNDTLIGGSGNDLLIGGPDQNKLVGNRGFNFYTQGEDLSPLPGLNLDLDSGLFLDNQVTPSTEVDIDGNPLSLRAAEVEQLLNRASAASPSIDAIIAIVDRGGRVLGVRVEEGVSPTIRNDPQLLTFAVDGALAKARTGAFFANDTAPLTSRTVPGLSESTILQREVESNPNVTDPISTVRGPESMARIGVGGHFPTGVDYTPQVDLAQIEHTNRDTTDHPGPDRIKGTADDVPLPNRFNIPDEVLPARSLDRGLFIKPPDSYGFASGTFPGAQPRGISTLPGGLPILRAYMTEIRQNSGMSDCRISSSTASP